MSKLVVVAGGWDPVHAGHIAHLRDAKRLAGKLGRLIVITHTDEMMVRKKGYCFLPLAERLEILGAIRWVNKMVVAEELGDNDGTVIRSLEALRPDIFAKGGDRLEHNMPEVELALCQRLGIQIVYGVGGGKIQSSSELVRRMREKARSGT